MLRQVAYLTLLLGVLFLGSMFAVGPAPADPPAVPYVPGEVILKFKDHATPNDKNQIYAELGGAKLKGFGQIKAELRQLGTLTVDEAISRYRNHSKIEYIEPNYVLEALEIPNDPLFPQLYGMLNTGQTGGTPGADIHATQAWDVFTGSPSALIGVIDTGVDYTHPDLAANIWTNPGEIPGNGIDDDVNGYVDDVHGYDFINNDGDPMDDNGHGSHVSGTIGAVGDNGVGVAGVNWNVKIMGLKFLSAGGSGSSADAIEAINYATMMGVRLTSNSWGGGGFSQAMLDAINAANTAGILFVAAAGNSGVNTDVSPHYPSSYPSANIIAVAATDHNDALASFSNYGATTVDLAAPGVNILSTFPGNQYGSISGTSMATPHVSGALGLIFGRFPAIAHTDARNLVLAYVDPKPGLAGKCVTGGRLNAFLPIADPDDTPPGMVGDLAVATAGSNWLGLGWSATGDDGGTGTASGYVVKFSTAPIDAGNFDAAMTAPHPPDPQAAGSPEVITVSGLDFSTVYYFALKARDEFGNTGPISNIATGTTLGAPDIDVTPTSLTETLLTGAGSTQMLTLSNLAEGTLDFTVPTPDLVTSPTAPQIYQEYSKDATDPRLGDPVAAGTGGPDGFGYRWVDSDEPFGPAFVWTDISAVGTVAHSSGDDATAGPFPIGFSFSFYGVEYDQFRVTTNGFLSFTSTSTAYSNQPLPNTGAPTNLVAPFWDDLLLSTTGDVYYHHDGSRLLVQWNGVPHYGSGGPYTFQAVLYPDGTIEYYYLSMASPTNSATIGIQNATGSDGLQVAFNQAYIHDNLAVRIVAVPQWLTVDPTGGTVYAPGSTTLNVHFATEGLLGGNYEGMVRVLSNDPDEPVFTVPVSLTVIGAPDVELAPANFDFGPVFLGASPSTTVLVQNPGTDVLNVSGVSVDNPAYNVDMTMFTVGPRSGQALTVTFTPSAVGMYPATLTVVSDDPDEPTITMSLSGSGVVPPDFSVTPASLSSALLTGETETQFLHLANSGGALLEWDIDLEYIVSSQMYLLTPPDPPTGPEADGGNPGEDLRTTPIQAELADLTGMDILWDRTHGQSTTSLWTTLIADFTSRGATLTQTGTGDVITPALLADYDVLWVSDLSQTWDAPEVTALVNWMAGGGGLLLEGDNNATVPIYNQLLDALGAGITMSLTDGSSGVSTNIHPHPTTENVAGVYFTANTASLEPPASPAGPLVDDDLGVPAVAYSQVGAGRIIVAADEIFQNSRMSQANNQLFGNQVMDWLVGTAFLSVSPLSGTVAPGGSFDVSVLFNAVGIFGGTYDADINVHTNDPSAELVSIPTSLQVTGAPDLTLDPTSIDFGEVFVGYADLLDYSVTNTGTDVLIITGVTSDHPAFTPDFTGVVLPLQLDPLHATVLRVRFAPTTAGYQTAALTLASNDPGTPNTVLSLAGTGRMPPAGSVAPASLHQDLLTGETATEPVVLSNTGLSDLEWSTSLQFLAATQVFTLAAPEPPTGPDEDGGTFEGAFRTTPIQAELADLTGVDILWDRSHGQSTTSLWTTLIADFTARGATLTQTGTADVITPALLLGYDVVWSSDTNQMWDPAELAALVDWMNGGGALLLEGDNAASVGVYNQLLTALGAGITFATTSGASGTSTIIYPHPTTQNVAGVYFTANVASIPDVVSPAGRLVDDVDGVPAAVYSQVGAGRIIAISDEVFQNSRMSQADNQLFGNQVMDWLSVPVFLSVDPEAGAVPPGGSTTVNVTFDAGGLFGGDYAGLVRFITNDPVNGVLDVTATMNVTGVPRIGFSAASLAFGDVFIGYPTSQVLTVQNIGTDQLSVGSIDPGLPDYSVVPATLELAPLQSMDVTVTFGPVTDGDRSTQLTFNSNDPDSPHQVGVTGYGVIPPVIDTSPAALSATAAPGDSETRTLTVCNTGGSDLIFEVSAREVSAAATVVHEEVVQPKGSDVPGGEEPVDPRPGVLGTGGPDMFGYQWTDSDEPGGPTFDWVDISAIGTPTDFPPYDLDGNFGPYPIGFNFPFYGNTFTEFHVCENGWISFTNGTLESYSNQALPNTGTGVPENMLAILWDDMVFDLDYDTYIVYHNDGSRLIIEYFIRRIAQFSPPFYKYQIILYPNGNIVYQYHTLGTTQNSATIGIQNATKDDGLTVVHNSAYVHENLAILFSSGPDWLSVTPESGVVPAGGCLDLSVLMDAAELEAGDYFGRIDLLSNDPATPLDSTPVEFHVCVVDLAAMSADPNTLNLASNGNFVTCYLELPAGYDPNLIVLDTVRLNGTVAPSPNFFEIGDWNENMVPDLMLKFPRAEVEAALPEGDSVPVTLTGDIDDQCTFTGTFIIRVIRPHLTQPDGGEAFLAGSRQMIEWGNPQGWEVDYAQVYYSPDDGNSWTLLADNVVGQSTVWAVPEQVTETGRVRVYLFDEAGVMGYDTSDGVFAIRTATTGVEGMLPTVHRLYQNSPNPFLSATQVTFDLPEDSEVTLKVYDLGGREVRVLTDGWYPAGSHGTNWDGRDAAGRAVAGGIYFLHIEAESFSDTKRMSLRR